MATFRVEGQRISTSSRRRFQIAARFTATERFRIMGRTDSLETARKRFHGFQGYDVSVVDTVTGETVLEKRAATARAEKRAAV